MSWHCDADVVVWTLRKTSMFEQHNFHGKHPTGSDLQVPSSLTIDHQGWGRWELESKNIWLEGTRLGKTALR